MLNISTFAISWLYTNTKATMKYCSFLMIYARPCGYTIIEETVLQEKRQHLTRSVSTTIKNRLPLFRKRKHLDWHRTRDVLCYFHVGWIWGSLAVWLFAVWKRQALIYCLQDDPHHCAGFCFKAVGYNWGRYVICLQHRNWLYYFTKRPRMNYMYIKCSVEQSVVVLCQFIILVSSGIKVTVQTWIIK